MHYIRFAARRFLLAAFLFFVLISAGLASDHLLQPFAINNLNPFVGVYGIAAMQSPVVLAPEQNSVNVVLDTVSHFTNRRNQSESIRIDGESYRLAVRVARGLPHQWEAGIEIPLLSHSGGFMDGFINQWHDTFGLPTLGRDRVADGQLIFRYARDDRVLVDVQSSTTGLGDILLFTGKTLKQTNSFAFTMRGQLKLPSGDANRLLGSGGTDISVSALLSQKWGRNWLGSIQFGGAYLETGDVVPELQRNWVGFGSAYIGWQPFGSFAFKLQLDAHSPVYKNSAIDQLTDTAYLLTIGASAKISRTTYLDIGVTEDEINPDVASDVSFQFRVRVVH